MEQEKKTHMKGICVKSEIAPLKKVLLHRPGEELLKLTPFYAKTAWRSSISRT